MTSLTPKELTAIEDQLNHEQTLINKYQAMACICTDNNVANQFRDYANKHQMHYDTLISFLK